MVLNLDDLFNDDEFLSGEVWAGSKLAESLKLKRPDPSTLVGNKIMLSLADPGIVQYLRGVGRTSSLAYLKRWHKGEKVRLPLKYLRGWWDFTPDGQYLTEEEVEKLLIEAEIMPNPETMDKRDPINNEYMICKTASTYTFNMTAAEAYAYLTEVVKPVKVEKPEPKVKPKVKPKIKTGTK